MMFKILILQRLYNISDAQAEYRIKDRLSFMRFLGLALCDTIPDEKTIWEYREHVTGANILDTIFYRFTRQLEEKKIITYSGSIIDATFADARRAKKNNEVHYGYKNHVKADKKHKIITKYRVTSAEVHDSRELKNLIDRKKDKRIRGRRVYRGRSAKAHTEKN
jgi:IS5 family transposase